MNIITKFVLLYIAAISVLTVILTVYDKLASKRSKWRVPESSLLIIGLFGGAFAEFITMQIIRHKTQHKKFMIVLPLEMVVHIAVVILLVYIKHN